MFKQVYSGKITLLSLRFALSIKALLDQLFKQLNIKKSAIFSNYFNFVFHARYHITVSSLKVFIKLFSVLPHRLAGTKVSELCQFLTCSLGAPVCDAYKNAFPCFTV